MKYVMNADDFGRDPARTAAIDACLRQGLIQRASLMVNMESTEEAAALAKAGSYMDRVCFHLNLTSGLPLTDAVRSTALCGKNGEFCRAKNKTVQCRCFSRKTIAAIRQECEAQMRKFRALGFSSTHMDSHLWCLCSFPVWLAVRPLMKRYGFRTVRTMKGHMYLTNSGKLSLYYRFLQFFIRCCGFKNPEVWSGCPDEFLKQGISAKKRADKAVEVYVHPNMIDGIPIDTVFSYQWERRPVAAEVEMLSGVGAIPAD